MKTFLFLPGMSTLAGMLLMYFGEEETFWALNILLTDKKVSFELLKKRKQNRDYRDLVERNYTLLYFRSLSLFTVRNAWTVYFGLSQINQIPGASRRHSDKVSAKAEAAL